MVFCHLPAGFIGFILSPVPAIGVEEIKNLTLFVAGVVSLPNYACPLPALNLPVGKAGTQQRCDAFSATQKT